MVRTITPNELKDRPSEFTIIDVRRKTDYDEKVILNAEWHNPDDVDQWAKSLPTDKEVVLYCARGGSVSNSVLDRLLATNVTARYIEGGIEGWKQSGGKVSPKKLP
jgi:rhodanese-related sulfurtransferase